MQSNEIKSSDPQRWKEIFNLSIRVFSGKLRILYKYLRTYLTKVEFKPNLPWAGSPDCTRFSHKTMFVFGLGDQKETQGGLSTSRAVVRFSNPGGSDSDRLSACPSVLFYAPKFWGWRAWRHPRPPLPTALHEQRAPTKDQELLRGSFHFLQGYYKNFFLPCPPAYFCRAFQVGAKGSMIG